jgi:hypothetical protein
MLTGCHSYFTIPKEDYNKISTMEDIKIVYTNAKEFIVEKNDTTYAKVSGDSLIVNRGTEEKFIQMSEVEKIKESRFDLGGTITISLVALTILVVLFFSMDPFKT